MRGGNTPDFRIPPNRTRTHAHTHTVTHTRAHTHAHTHTHARAQTHLQAVQQHLHRLPVQQQPNEGQGSSRFSHRQGAPCLLGLPPCRPHRPRALLPAHGLQGVWDGGCTCRCAGCDVPDYYRYYHNTIITGTVYCDFIFVYTRLRGSLGRGLHVQVCWM